MNEILQALNAFKQDLKDIKTAIDKFVKPAPHPLAGAWLDGQDVMILLHISKRSLQNLRDSSTLPYSRINGKFYYKADDIKDLLEKNYSLNFNKENVKPLKS
jgi:hypothetical protein